MSEKKTNKYNRILLKLSSESWRSLVGMVSRRAGNTSLSWSRAYDTGVDIAL